tara:strand:- start:26883 stop:27065 length:183 start_codon:yes stop_codon:yes gene_type:complete
VAPLEIGKRLGGSTSEKFCRLFGVIVGVPALGGIVADSCVEFVIAADNDIDHPALVCANM